MEQGGEADVRILNAEDRILAPHVRCKEWYPAPGAPKRAVQNRLGWERWSRLKFTQGVNVMSVPASNVRARKARKGDEQFYRQVDTCNFFISVIMLGCTTPTILMKYKLFQYTRIQVQLNCGSEYRKGAVPVVATRATPICLPTNGSRPRVAGKTLNLV